ncbi:MAG: LLM class flavin-dependent oxidoreductase [Deltaproteobacteria bacterium]|nr:LLM class flavin-dependent oxidoreductase [Deltaproteobacteria bacterium]
MRVGLLYQHTGPDGDFAPVIEQIAKADHLGFDTVWLEEHPGAPGALGSLAIVLGALSKRTRAIRLGGFSALALAHPIRTAEDFAVVDLLAGGRLNFGVTPYADAEGCRRYRVPAADCADRFREALDLVLAAWVFDEFSYGGRCHQFPAHTTAGTGLQRKRLGDAGYRPQWERGPETPDFLTVTPKPLQQPRPPVWLRADQPEWITFAAERGHSLVLPAGAPQLLQAAAQAYDSALTRAGRDRSSVELAVITDLPFDGSRLAAHTLSALHQLHGASGLNHLIWRVPYPQLPQPDLIAALAQFAAEIHPMLQA